MIVDHIAIVGLGSIGRRHLRNLKAIRPEIEVTLVRSGHGEEWPELALADRIVFSLHDAIAVGIQAAIISSPATLHVEQSTILARAGVHLLVEKPLSHNSVGVDDLLIAANQSGISALTGYILRYDPAARAYKKLLENDKLGQLLHVRVETGSCLPDWRPEQDYRQTVSAQADQGGGVLLELSHEFDYIRWFFGEMTSVVANLYNSNYLELQVEECADLILTNHNGIPVSLHLDFHRRHPARLCVAEGSEGTATWNAISNQVTWRPVNGASETEDFSYSRDEVFQCQLRHFIRCIEEGDKPLVSLQDGAKALALVEAAKIANETGRKQVFQ
ncbi:MAG: Gfo/Idh/MocA family oxidoreductase [Gammaproteobacteria bacterium]|nr:Gfo/Idh/MocA family oxidoreductase [Gammaproteobacteria bacterium]